LKDVQIIDPAILSGNKVAFGSTITVLTEDGTEKSWTIVGEGEAEFHENGISWQSPVGKALLGKLVGDVVVIKRPAGEAEYEITDLYFGTKHYLQT
jgi:transcription elongation GreA/GreB family factor